MSGYSFDRSSKKVPLIQTEFRKIQTSIPVEGTETILSELDRYESRSMHGQLPIVWDKAVDSCIFDAAGNQWIDFTSTIFVTNIGHSNPHLISSLKDTLDNELLHTYAYPNKIRARYHKKLIEFTQGGFEKAFLMSAGTEACEAALKLMRLSGQKKGKCRLGIVTLEGNWHGRTMGAQLMSSNLKQKQWIGHSDPDIHHIPFPYPWALQDSSPEEFLASPASVQTRLKNMVSGNDVTFGMRTALWTGREIFKDYPLTGCGFRCVDLVNSQYPDPTGHVKRLRGMHNNFIQLAVDTGILGLTAWLGIWFCFFRLLYHKAVDRERDPPENWAVFGSAAAVLAFLAGGCFESNLYDSEVAMVLYFIMALPFAGSPNKAPSQAQ